MSALQLTINPSAQTGSAQSQLEQLRLVADTLPAQIALYEAGTMHCLFANKQYAQLYGCDEKKIVGMHLQEIIGAAGYQAIQPMIDEFLRTEAAVNYERVVQSPDGQQRTIEVTLTPHFDPPGQLSTCCVLISDITRHREAQRRVKESEERLSKFLDASAEGILFHQGGFTTDINPVLCRMIGYQYDEAIGRSTLEFVVPSERARVAAVIASGKEVNYETIALHKDGTQIPVELIVRSLVREGEITRMTIVRDIRDRRKAQQQIARLALHDPLTGLPNRGQLLQSMSHCIEIAQLENQRVACLFIDLDNFKRVNDSLGHHVGDELLKIVAGRLRRTLRESDVVSRLGGDEFVVVLPDAHESADIGKVAGKLIEAVSEPITIHRHLLSVTPSIGVAMYPQDGKTADTLIKNADAAMYLAKNSGRANYRFFNADISQAAYRAFLLESELTEAVRRQEFALYFQPQFDCKANRLVGVEALIRWKHPQRGMVNPAEFIPVAEGHRMMLPISRWVLNEALAMQKHWRAAGNAMQCPVAINLSSMQFNSEDFVAEVLQALQVHDLPGACLEVELTERMLTNDAPASAAKLAELKRAGVKIAIDDFGTGYSSMVHLRTLPIDRLKIDRSFVNDLTHARDALAISSAIINLAHSLGLEVTAEGVETQAQCDALNKLGCDALQGYLIARPMPAAEFEAWVQNGCVWAGQV